MSRTFKNFLFFMIGFLIMIFAGIASADVRPNCYQLYNSGHMLQLDVPLSDCIAGDYIGMSLETYIEFTESSGGESPTTEIGFPKLPLPDAIKLSNAIGLLWASTWLWRQSRKVT